jgi:hypothetical protein
VDWNPTTDRPLDEDAFKEWQGRLERGLTVQSRFHELWDRNLARTYPPPETYGDVSAINPQTDFRNVETKRAALFYDVPEVRLTPTDLKLVPTQPPMPGMPAQPPPVTVEGIAAMRERVLNHKLGPDGANVKRAYTEGLVDTLAVSGFLVHKIGYRNTTVEVETLQPGMLGLPPTPVTVQVPVHEECFWSYLSSRHLIIPDDFHSTNFDQAPWLAVKFPLPLNAQTKREFKLPDDFSGGTTDETSFKHNRPNATSGENKILVTEIWYKAAQFDPTVVNPELYRKLVLVDGLEAPAEHRDSPYQSVDAYGRLTDDSMIGNPIHVGTILTVPDSAYVPSHVSVTANLGEELIKFRTQSVRYRDASLPKTLMDGSQFTQDQKEKLTKGDIGAVIDTLPGALGGGADKILAPVANPPLARENFTTQDYIERDMERAWAISSNQQAQFSKGKRTATEARLVQGNSDARSESEREAVRAHFVKGVRKFDAVLQRYLTQEHIVKILGPDAAAMWQQWKAVAGKYAYHIRPDSGVHVDAAMDRAQAMETWTNFANDPNINRVELLKPIMTKLGYDSGKVVREQPPAKPPDAPKLNIAFKAEDFLIPPIGRLLLDLLAQAGFQMSAEAIMKLSEAHQAIGASILGGEDTTPGAPQTEHTGLAAKVEPLNKHQEERTRGVQGTVQ